MVRMLAYLHFASQYGTLVDMTSIVRRSDCPISSALDIFGDKWTLLVIRDLLFRGKSRYGEFLASHEGIATNILADRLVLLQRAGLIKRSKDAAYRLTSSGIDLLPMLAETILWSAAHVPGVFAPTAFIQNLRKDKTGTIASIRKDLRKKKYLFPDA